VTDGVHSRLAWAEKRKNELVEEIRTTSGNLKEVPEDFLVPLEAKEGFEFVGFLNIENRLAEVMMLLVSALDMMMFNQFGSHNERIAFPTKSNFSRLDGYIRGNKNRYWQVIEEINPEIFRRFVSIFERNEHLDLMKIQYLRNISIHRTAVEIKPVNIHEPALVLDFENGFYATKTSPDIEIQNGILVTSHSFSEIRKWIRHCIFEFGVVGEADELGRLLEDYLSITSKEVQAFTAIAK